MVLMDPFRKVAAPLSPAMAPRVFIPSQTLFPGFRCVAETQCLARLFREEIRKTPAARVGHRRTT